MNGKQRWLDNFNFPHSQFRNKVRLRMSVRNVCIVQTSAALPAGQAQKLPPRWVAGRQPGKQETDRGNVPKTVDEGYFILKYRCF